MSKVHYETPYLNRLHAALCVPDEPDYSECHCPSCGWSGFWDDCWVKIIPRTWEDPEEVYYQCPDCQDDVEEAD